jgi:hypothetical protein
MVLARSLFFLLFCCGLFPFDFAKIYPSTMVVGLCFCSPIMLYSVHVFRFWRNIASYSSLLNC